MWIYLDRLINVYIDLDLDLLLDQDSRSISYARYFLNGYRNAQLGNDLLIDYSYSTVYHVFGVSIHLGSSSPSIKS